SQNIENKRRHTRGELLAYGFCFLLLLFILFPLLVVLADAFFPLLLEKRKVGMGLDLQGFRYVWQWYSPHLWLSLKLGILSVIACLGIGVPASYGFLKYPGWGTQLLEEMLLLPLSIPGIALALALIQTYSILRGAWYLILVGHTLYALPFLVRSVTGALRQGKVLELERCAASLGASRWQRFRYVLFPYLRHAMMVGSLLVFAISFGEFNVSFLLNTPVNQTFPAGLYLTYIQNSVSISSAATTLFLLVVIPILLALQYGGGKAADALPHQQA
ncbi:MAG: ABC transporter permease subunit, partial [Nitrospinota bacterium]